ncbi:transmembrane protein 94 isoform X2 [Frankliniella occidentalis]|uniref:Transmembrane protein 94 isoform X2 n=1 Tax=Frankliniella occidentalis TaxID=133901 RepID=A0A6J1SMK6_FRAOC|nr:transmembrane protein 94 isoform X2 [Frankliniella occidentalis]
MPSTANLEARSLMDDVQTVPEIISAKQPKTGEKAEKPNLKDVENNFVGLSTKEALSQLYTDIHDLLREQLLAKEHQHKYSWLYETLYCRSNYTTICWTSALALLICSVCMLVSYVSSDHPRLGTLPLEATLVFILTIVNVSAVAWDNKLRHNEIPLGVSALLHKVKEAVEWSNWKPENYPHLCSPLSPCITLQWTHRDGKLVNLPWALLVAGDVVVMRPGQPAPGPCSPIDADRDLPNLQTGELFSPAPSKRTEIFSLPTSRAPLQNEEYVLKQTPYINNLRIAMEQALNRPITYYNSQRHNLMLKYVELIFLPTILILVLLVNLVRLGYLHHWVSSGSWIEMLLLQPVAIVLPLLPLVFPTTWLLLNCLGMARLLAILDLSPHENNKCLDPFEDVEAEPQQNPLRLSWQSIRNHFSSVLLGTEPILCRSANILHVLGSMTALCCVDKKGILSWPNPTAEKVFFLRNASPTSHSSSLVSEDAALYTDTGAVANSMEVVDANEDTKIGVSNNESSTVAEVLDLTHDHSSPFRLQFDDHTWKQYLSSLKPLGLAILLNTCNMATQEHYAAFCAHVTCEALHDEDLVPVTNRRNHPIAGDAAALPAVNKCLCELAKQIGFVDKAQDLFQLQQQLSTFRHVQPELARRDIKFARSLPIATKLKFPFPHMVAVVVQEQTSHSLQLMSQGTADIILDSCVEYWDGRDLCTLSQSDRKKVLDFYQRSSLTAYCTAFAYRPLSRAISPALGNVYLELPADSRHLYAPHRSPTPLALDSKSKGLLANFQSTDSLFGYETKETEVTSVEECFELQCNQVFVGMVTMQYQAQIDMVKLIEQLERACVRFVHFSKENELRSRVFSEKMGLESGWNCHISLLSERNRSGSDTSDIRPGPSRNYSNARLASSVKQHINLPLQFIPPRNLPASRTMSLSAPSAINLEHSFPPNPPDWETSNNRDGCDDEGLASQDSVALNEGQPNQEAWRSLSCLTDSTEQSAPINFDMSNRAKLPRGIDKIRPHLEQIDNVPLLVSLFTDCTPDATREMLHIMQEYGEVVCVLGSAANAENMGIFLQADASIAVEPLYPQVCQKVAVLNPVTNGKGPGPTDLSRALNSVACSLRFKRDNPISLFQLIMEARHFMQCVWNCVQFWVCCGVSLSTLQTLGVFLMLPPLFTTGQVMWFVCVIIPVLSLSLVGSPIDSQVMQRPTSNKQGAVISSKRVAIFVVWCYGAKFLPTIIVVLLLYAVTLDSFCKEMALARNETCTMVYPTVDPDASLKWGGWDNHFFGLLIAQHFSVMVLLLHFVCISISFVHREYLSWHKWPHNNVWWLCTSLIVLLVQAVYSVLYLGAMSLDAQEDASILNVPWLAMVLALISPFAICVINEFVKWEEIKANVRYQKRARLEFGTKLGMNSPF